MKRKLAIILIMLILIIASLINTVKAASFTASMTPSKTTVAESNEFTVKIRVSNLDVGSTGINTFEGVLSYSTQVFERISSDSIDGNNGWQPTYNEDNGKLMLYKQGFLNEDADIVQITFKAKTGVSGKTGDIKLSDIKASNSGETIEANSISTIITIGEESPANAISNSTTNTPANTQRPSTINITRNNTISNIASNTNTNSANNAVSSYVPVTNNTTASTEDDIPYTGTSDNIMRAIFVVLVIAGISYFKYESIKER